MEQTTLTIIPAKIDGFECDTCLSNVRIHTVMTSVAFLPHHPLFSTPHNHPLFEAHLIVGGNINMVTPKGTFRMQKNDLCLLPPCLYHCAETIDGDVSSISFSFSFSKEDSEDTSDLYSALCERLGTLSAPLFFGQAFSVAHSLFELTEEMSRSHAGKEDRLKTKTAEVLFCLIDLLCPDCRGEYRDNLSLSTQQRLKIDSFFARNHHKDVSLKNLADALYLSERHTNRMLLDLYRLTFRQKLIEVRVQSAMHLLQSTTLSVAEIAKQSGYQSEVGFHSAFRKATGTTPAKYRSMMKQAKNNG